MIPLRTERLALRPFRDSDADFVLEVHQHPGLRRFVPEQALEDLEGVPARLERFGRFDDDPVLGIVCIERLADGAPVGLVMLVPIPPSAGVDVDDVEIGWRGHPEHGGQGYVAEAARAVLDHALGSGLPRVVAVTDPDNAPSQSVCRRIGMDDRGTTDDYYDEGGARLFVAERSACSLDDGVVVDRLGAPVGRATLGPVVGGDALLWYEIDEPHRGRGYATRAVAQSLRQAREGGVRRVVAEAAVASTASRKVLERNGFEVVETDGPLFVGEDEELAVRYVRDLR